MAKITIDNVSFDYKRELFTNKQKCALLGVTLLALAAIGAGILAVQAVAGHNVWIFHCLGAMGDQRALLLMAAGLVIFTTNICYHIHNYNVSKASITSDREAILDNFTYLAAESKKGAEAAEKAKNKDPEKAVQLGTSKNQNEDIFCCHLVEIDGKTAQSFIFRNQKGYYSLAIFEMPLVSEEHENPTDLFETRKCDDYLNNISDQGSRMLPNLTYYKNFPNAQK